MAVEGMTPASDRSAALPVRISGLGTYLPERVVTNDDWAAELDTSDEWITTRTGIRERHVAAPNQATSDLAAAAGKAALADAGYGVEDVSTVVLATTTPDHPIPGTAPIVSAALGTEAPAFDVNAACSGFVYGLEIAGSLALRGGGPVLLIGAETLSRVTDRTDRSTAVLFGDGAGAVVLERDPFASLGPFDAGADGTLAEILVTPAGGTRTPVDPDVLESRDQFLTMRGGEVYRQAVTRMAASSERVLTAAGASVEDIDLFVGHQANQRILDAVARRIGMPDDRCHLTVDRHGNTSAASIPLALGDARASGRLKPGTRVLLTAFGAGITWASCLLTWTGRNGS
ncbi:MAG: beta-ketoacyl-ACP synthase III [Nitriliruptorales bacterium]|nr:beta-ketoacyl-ACP synthase III [Nitriliruptorales bacterium]